MAPVGQTRAQCYIVHSDSAVIMLINNESCLSDLCVHQTYNKCLLLLGSLEATMTKLGSGVNELEFDSLSGLARCVHEQRLGEEERHKDVHILYMSCKYKEPNHLL